MSQSSAYPLGRDTMAATRLDLQHYLWTASLGFHLHPKIPLPAKAQIADVGCGTGIWSCTFPQRDGDGIHIDASDISLSQTPPKEWLPAHVTTRQLDILAQEGVPADLRGKYDVVHVRLFLLVVQNNDPAAVLRNLLALLKPGGYLQWQEYNLANTAVVTAGDAAADAPHLTALHNAMNAGALRKTSWVANFPEQFSSSPAVGGLAGAAELVEHLRVRTPAHLLTLQHECNFLGAREYAAQLAAEGGSSALAAAHLEDLFAKAEHECWTKLRRGAAIATEFVTWVIRKAEAPAAPPPPASRQSGQQRSRSRRPGDEAYTFRLWDEE